MTIVGSSHMLAFSVQSRPDTARRPIVARRAFTLLELLLVLLVLAVLASIALPSLLGLERSQGAKSFAGDLLVTARYARMQSAADGVKYRLNVDPANGRFWLTRQEGQQFVLLGTDAGRLHEAPEGVSLVWDDAYMTQYMADPESAANAGQVVAPRLPNEFPYVEFTPTGRVDPSIIGVVDRDGKMMQIVHPSVSEPVRLVRPDGTTAF